MKCHYFNETKNNQDIEDQNNNDDDDDNDNDVLPVATVNISVCPAG